MIRRGFTVFFLAASLSVGALVACASEATSSDDDPALDKRVSALAQQLRCVVCQNETVADSPAPLAADMRREIRNKMKAGQSDKEIVAYLTRSYGDFVLYNPPVKPRTYLLWFGPFILLAGGLFALFRSLKHRRRLIQERPLSDAERRRAQEILKTEDPKELA